jgi:ParB/RepB/Spo0J family partition protein
MRADMHYVDQLAAPAGGPPVRFIEIDQIATKHTAHPGDLRPLIESIRSHGILHPLLVTRNEIGYAVIAGHKRLAAARLLRLTTVPCFVHAVDEARAALLADADNLQTAAPAQAETEGPRTKAVRQTIAQHLATVQASAALIETSPPHLARAALDLMNAHAWRAARLLDVLDAAELRLDRTARRSPLVTVIERVVGGFANEARLSGVDVSARVKRKAAGTTVDDRDLSLIVSSGVLATMSLVDQTHVDRPAILVSASKTAEARVRLVIEQTCAHAPAALAGRFFDEGYGDRAGGWVAVACALAVQTAAERLGASAACTVDSNGHTSLAIEWTSV